MNSPPFPEAAVAAARDAVKVELRVENSADDAAIERAAAAAMALCEAFTGQALILREWTQCVTAGRGWQLLAPVPVVAIEPVAADGDSQPLPADAFAIDIDAGGRGWVQVSAGASTAVVQVRMTAGIASQWSELPAPIAQGITRMAAHLLEARDGAAPPAAVAALWRPWRRLRLSREHRA